MSAYHYEIKVVHKADNAIIIARTVTDLATANGFAKMLTEEFQCEANPPYDISIKPVLSEHAI